MSRMNDDQHSLKEVIDEFIKKNKLQGGIDKIDVRNAWINLMGTGVNNYTSDIQLKQSTLYVNLTSSVLREELSYGKTKIIKMINEELGKELVMNIILR